MIEGFSHLFFKNHDDGIYSDPNSLSRQPASRPSHCSQCRRYAGCSSFYGHILGLQELVGAAIPDSLIDLVKQGRVANFTTPDGTIIDLFAEPDLLPPAADPTHQFTRANHLAFDIAPDLFDVAVTVLHAHGVKIDGEPVTRSTGRGIYCYDPDGFIVEIRCDPQ
jgi:glyoxylase I family protein